MGETIEKTEVNTGWLDTKFGRVRYYVGGKDSIGITSGSDYIVVRGVSYSISFHLKTISSITNTDRFNVREKLGNWVIYGSPHISRKWEGTHKHVSNPARLAIYNEILTAWSGFVNDDILLAGEIVRLANERDSIKNKITEHQDEIKDLLIQLDNTNKLLWNLDNKII